jgi:hypothetical protein
VTLHHADWTSLHLEREYATLYNPAGSLDRHEVWDADGALRTTFLRRHRIRWWTQDQVGELLRDCGYVDVESVGSQRDFVVYASAG